MQLARRSSRGPVRSKAGAAKRTPARYTNERDFDLARALRLHRGERYEEAAALYRRVVARRSTSLDAWMNLAGASVRLGRALDALDALRRGIEIGAGDPRVQRDAAMGFAALGAWGEARAAYERALVLDAAMLGARLGLVRVCLESGDRAAALENARRATALAPQDASAWMELHRACFDDRALSPAIDAATRAVALRPDHAIARLFLAGALLWDGAHDRARDVLAAGALDAGLVDAAMFCARHRETARVVAATREGLLLACESATLSGPVVELGVRHGVSTRLLANSCATEVHAFDGFFGLPRAWHDKPQGSFSASGRAPIAPANVTFHVGAFEDTLPGFAASLRQPPRLVHVDSDLYSSAATALSELGPHLAPETVILFDEYVGNTHWRDDEHRAFEEAVARFDWRFEVLAVSWITGQWCVRLTA